jgi:hypothetical protein
MTFLTLLHKEICDLMRNKRFNYARGLLLNKARVKLSRFVCA